MRRRIFAGIITFSALIFHTRASEPPKFIHVFVALADNQHQGIIPVPPKIGNGDDPANNLYWGCSNF